MGGKSGGSQGQDKRVTRDMPILIVNENEMRQPTLPHRAHCVFSLKEEHVA